MWNRKGDGGGQIRQCASDFVVAQRFLCKTLGLKDLYEHPTTMSNLIRSHILSRARKLFLFFFFLTFVLFCFVKAGWRSRGLRVNTGSGVSVRTAKHLVLDGRERRLGKRSHGVTCSSLCGGRSC